MNNRSKEIIEDAVSQGKWVWLEIDDNSNSLYLEFENLKLSSRPILDNSYRGELAIRFGQNIYFAVFFNEKKNLDFLRFDEDYLNQLLNSNEYLSLRYHYFYQEFSKKVIEFKFQNQAGGYADGEVDAEQGHPELSDRQPLFVLGFQIGRFHDGHDDRQTECLSVRTAVATSQQEC